MLEKEPLARHRFLRYKTICPRPRHNEPETTACAQPRTDRTMTDLHLSSNASQLEIDDADESTEPTLSIVHHGEAPQLTLGYVVRTLRRQRTDMSARALSIYAGLSESYVGKVETGNMDPSMRAFAKIAVALQLSPGELAVIINREAHQIGRQL